MTTPLDKFYVYAYLREDGTPYYVGKGKGPRAFHKYHRFVSTPPKERIAFLARNVNEPDALQAEMLLIRMYGRRDDGTGILRNLTDGGEGTMGQIFTPERRRQQSKAMKGRVRSESHCKAISKAKKGTVISAEHRRKLSQALAGRIMSAETRAKMSESRKLRAGAFVGASNGRAILTVEYVATIRTGALKEKEACGRFGISRTQFYRVKRGEQWTQI